jgi:rubrerythrin
MDGEAGDAQLYAVLSRLVAGGPKRQVRQLAAQALLRLSGDEIGHLKRLRAYYFLLTGEAYTPPSSCPLIRGINDALRHRYAAEKKASDAYLAASVSASSDDLPEIYRALAADEARHLKTICFLLENTL